MIGYHEPDKCGKHFNEISIIIYEQINSKTVHLTPAD